MNLYGIKNTRGYVGTLSATDEADALDQAEAQGWFKNRAKATVYLSDWDGQFVPTVRGFVTFVVPSLRFTDVLAGKRSTPGVWMIHTPEGERHEYPLKEG